MQHATWIDAMNASSPIPIALVQASNNTLSQWVRELEGNLHDLLEIDEADEEVRQELSEEFDGLMDQYRNQIKPIEWILFRREENMLWGGHYYMDNQRKMQRGKAIIRRIYRLELARTRLSLVTEEIKE